MPGADQDPRGDLAQLGPDRAHLGLYPLAPRGHLGQRILQGLEEVLGGGVEDEPELVRAAVLATQAIRRQVQLVRETPRKSSG